MELALGEFSKAEQTFKASLDIYPQQPFSLFQRGLALERLDRDVDALRCYNQAISLQADLKEVVDRRRQLVRRMSCRDVNGSSSAGSADDYLQEGAQFFVTSEYERALECFDMAIRLRPGLAQAHNNRGSTLFQLGMWDEALDSYSRAIEADNRFFTAYVNKGGLLHRIGRFSESIECTARAIALQPNDVGACSNHACNLIMQNRIKEAMPYLDRALAHDPDNLDATWNKATCKLTTGELEEGFRLYESRTRKMGFPPLAQYGKPVWLGETAIRGRTLLVIAEQGLGDFIQFARYIPLLEEQGARVIVEAPEALCALLRSLSETTAVIEQGEDLPDYDLVCPVTSLPFAFKTTLDTIPSKVPYLRADPEKRKAWGDRLSGGQGLRVGLVWSGGFRIEHPELWSTNERRNIPLTALAPLNMPGLTFYSIQLGEDAVRQLQEVNAVGWNGPEIIDYTFHIDDFSDTAAFVDNLDLVISVDTSTAHLVGALGKPVWILNRFDTCWRWLLERSDSPWYPTAKIFRQPAIGDWASVVSEVRRELEKLLASRAV